MEIENEESNVQRNETDYTEIDQTINDFLELNPHDIQDNITRAWNGIEPISENNSIRNEPSQYKREEEIETEINDQEMIERENEIHKRQKLISKSRSAKLSNPRTNCNAYNATVTGKT